MNITITIPDAIKDRVILGFSSCYGYKPYLDLPDGEVAPNPETRAVFARRTLIKLVKDAVQHWEAEQAEHAARTASVADTEKLSIT
jgi:hypothetical protein